MPKMILAVLFMGGCLSPTSSTPLTEAEQHMVELVACYGGETVIEVSFFNEAHMVKVDHRCESDCEMTAAAGLAYLPSKHVGFWRTWVEGGAGQQWVAAHEVCHVVRMTWDEEEATKCASQIWEQCT
jgi:hypothetical protein